MTLPWRGTTPEIASEVDSRYETPGGAQNKVNVSQEYLLNLLKLAVTGLSDGSEAAIARYSDPYDITYDWLKDRLDAMDTKELHRNIFNVKDYGAKGDGVTNDYLSIQAAVNDAVSKGGGVVYFPRGDFLSTTSIAVTSSPLQFEGSGPGVSNVKFSGCDGFVVNDLASSNKYPMQFYNLSIQSGDVGLYTGIKFTGEPTPSISKQLTVDNVEITGTNNGTCWETGIKLTYGQYSDIRNTMIRGCTSDINKMKYGVYMDGSTDVKLIGNFYYWLSVGVNIVGETSSSEGIVIRDSHFAPCNYGVVNQDNTGNYMIVSTCHIDGVKGGVVLGRSGVNGGSFSQILNNLIFKDGASTDSFIGINIQAASQNKIIGNDIALSGTSGTENGIVINGTLGFPSVYNQIVANNIVDQDGAAILLFDYTENNLVTSNSGFSDGAGVIDGGVNNSVYSNTFNGQAIPKELTATQTINPGAITAGQVYTSLITLTGASYGRFVSFAAPYDLQDMVVTAYVQSANNVAISIYNGTGTTKTLASGSWKVKVYG